MYRPAEPNWPLARILEIFIWQRLTDLFGAVPFSKTTEDATDVNNKPVYDSQESIYRQLITDLDAAIANINATDESYGNADFYYKVLPTTGRNSVTR